MTGRKEQGKGGAAGGRPAADAERRARVGKVIRKYRLAAGLDQPALAARLGCTKTAVGNWELGLSRPDIDNVPRLCRELRIPVTELLGMPAEAALPAEDEELLAAYHGLDLYNRRTIRLMAERLAFQQDGREKERLRQSYTALRLYEDAAAAGVGSPMADYGESRRIFALSKNVPGGTDCVIRVNGRSMEPAYADGSYVYVDSRAEVQPGQTGIFIVNGEAFIKEYQPDGLYSLNPAYQPIRISEGSDVRRAGRVTGAAAAEDIARGALEERIEAAFAEEEEVIS